MSGLTILPAGNILQVGDHNPDHHHKPSSSLFVCQYVAWGKDLSVSSWSVPSPPVPSPCPHRDVNILPVELNGKELIAVRILVTTDVMIPLFILQWR